MLWDLVWCEESWRLTEVMRGWILSRIPRTASTDLQYYTQPRHPHLHTHLPHSAQIISKPPGLLFRKNSSQMNEKYLQPIMWTYFSIFIKWNNLMIHQNPKSVEVQMCCIFIILLASVLICGIILRKFKTLLLFLFYLNPIFFLPVNK